MTAPTTIAATKLLIYVGTGGDSPGSPDVFSEPCGLTTKASALTAATNTTIIPDCTDPTLAAWEAKDVLSLSHEVTGAGVLACESFSVWNLWFMGGTERACRIILTSPTTLPNSLGYYSGNYILTNFTQTGERGTKVTINVTLANNGTIAWVVA